MKSENVLKLTISIFLILQGLLPNFCFAQIINVPGDYETIQEAVNEASDNDTILVNPGIYYENIIIDNKNIVIGSLYLTTNNEEYIDQTIIDGSENGRVFYYLEVDEPCLLSGFTIQNGNTIQTGYGGGGIGIGQSPNIELANLKIINNTVKEFGGGVCVFYSNVNISNIQFSGNIATGSSNPPTNGLGGALFSIASQINFTNCDFINNISTLGGAVSEQQSSNMYLNCSFVGNTSSYPGAGVCTFNGNVEYEKCYFENNSGDGAIYVDGTNMIVNNCLITNNDIAMEIVNSATVTISNSTITNNNCIHLSPINIFQLNDIYIFNSILWNTCEKEIWLSQYNNLHISNSIIKGGFEGVDTSSVGNSIYWYEGILNTNPQFIDNSYQLSDYSNCIGAGVDSIEMNGIWFWSPTDDFNSNPRPSPTGTFPDLGAFENPLGNPVDVFENNTKGESNFKIYPNPATTQLSISTNHQSPINKITIYNQLGQKVFHSTQISSSIDISMLSQGMYIIEVASDEFRIREKLMIRK